VRERKRVEDFDVLLGCALQQGFEKVV